MMHLFESSMGGQDTKPDGQRWCHQCLSWVTPIGMARVEGIELEVYVEECHPFTAAQCGHGGGTGDVQ